MGWVSWGLTASTPALFRRRLGSRDSSDGSKLSPGQSGKQTSLLSSLSHHGLELNLGREEEGGGGERADQASPPSRPPELQVCLVCPCWGGLAWKMCQEFSDGQDQLLRSEAKLF